MSFIQNLDLKGRPLACKLRLEPDYFVNLVKYKPSNSYSSNSTKCRIKIPSAWCTDRTPFNATSTPLNSSELFINQQCYSIVEFLHGRLCVISVNNRSIQDARSVFCGVCSQWFDKSHHTRAVLLAASPGAFAVYQVVNMR